MDCCNINCIAFCTQPDVVWQKGIYLDVWHAMALADRDLNGQQFKNLRCTGSDSLCMSSTLWILAAIFSNTVQFCLNMCCEFFSPPVYRIVHPRQPDTSFFIYDDNSFFTFQIQGRVWWILFFNLPIAELKWKEGSEEAVEVSSHFWRHKTL